MLRCRPPSWNVDPSGLALNVFKHSPNLFNTMTNSPSMTDIILALWPTHVTKGGSTLTALIFAHNTIKQYYLREEAYAANELPPKCLKQSLTKCLN